MRILFKYLLFSSVPGILLTIVLAMNWGEIFNDVQYGVSQQAESFYEQNRPDFVETIEETAGKFSNSQSEPAYRKYPCINYEAKVYQVSDGDTVILIDGKKKFHTIRMRGIDAPETAQDFGNQSKKYLSSLIFDKQIKIETCGTDRFERELALIKLGDRSINQSMVKSGYAHYYKNYSDNLMPDDKLALAEAEVFAKTNRKGLWANPNPMLPSDFRKFTNSSN